MQTLCCWEEKFFRRLQKEGEVSGCGAQVFCTFGQPHRYKGEQFSRLDAPNLVHTGNMQNFLLFRLQPGALAQTNVMFTRQAPIQPKI